MKSIKQKAVELCSYRNLAFLVITLSLVLVSGISFSREDFFHNHIENFTPFARNLMFRAFVFMLFAYGIFLFGEKNIFRKKEIIVVIFLLLVALVTPPLLSRDIAGYVLGARNFVWFHVNPYLSALNSVEGNMWNGEIGWELLYPYSYGHIFLIIASIAVLPNFVQLIGAVYFFKLFVGVAYLLSIFIFSEIAKKISLGRTVVFLYAINPALLINGLVDGHNDVFIILFLLCAIYFLLNSNGYRSNVFWVLSVFVKYNTLIFLPVFWMRNGKVSIKRSSFSIILIAVLFLVFVAVFFERSFGSFWHYASTMKDILQARCLYACSPIVSLLDLFFGNFSNNLRLGLFFLGYIFLFFKFLFRKGDFLKFMFWSSLMLAFIVTRWITPWYVLVTIPLGLLIDEKKYKIIVFLITAYSLLHFFGV